MHVVRDVLSPRRTFISYPLGNNPSTYGPGGIFGGYQVQGTPFSTGINDSKFFTAGGTGDYHVYDIGIFYLAYD